MRVVIKNVRLSFPQLFTPKAFEEGADPSYSATFLMNKETNAADIALIKKTMNTIAGAKWPNGVPGGLKVALRDGSEKDHVDGYGADMMFIGTGARQNQPPQIVDKNPQVPVTERDGKIYAGCYVNAVLTIWAQDNKWGKRINAQLDVVQFVGDGDSFGTPKVNPSEVLGNLEDNDAPLPGSDEPAADLF